MPYYDFENVDTGKVDSVFYHMSETKDYAGPKGDQPGKWRRVWSNPQAAFDSRPVDPHSARDFSRVTNKKGTVGELWDRSAEMSAKRADKEGVDPIKSSFYKDYARKHPGKSHPAQIREKQTDALKKVGITVHDWGDH